MLICLREVLICPREAGKKFSHVFCIKMAVLGKKRPWLLWSFNGRPTLGRQTDAIAESAYK